ncbi:GNAT family N-acetyltransferase [Paenibacillus antri]|uniref:GNAT family N-acetyltransferase n=1 Tax=Paenibacillus antri TaxID=2582848 RepID=A0A5R9G1F9_9BACL|nr:GNAT family N-acetyltransferase [Paenibacillus antri]TLS49631.1 GNAT family N-acetyltransferase [Paenibacillus antri]
MKLRYRELKPEDAVRVAEIDRSETIERLYAMTEGSLTAEEVHIESPAWDDKQTREMIDRFRKELSAGGTAVGCFEDGRLVGFGVLSGAFRGDRRDRLAVDLMYVSRSHRRRGIGTRLLRELSAVAADLGAKQLYVSSTETESAVSFYRKNGGEPTPEVDPELFEKEPHDIHMVIEL